MHAALWCLVCAVLQATGVLSQQSSADFTPLWLPLAVRTPHLNAWVRSDTTAWATSPFGAADHVLAWAGYARVDGTVYTFTGTPFKNATSSQVWRVTPTRTVQTSQAGPVQLTVTWLSPIEPDDLVKQSMPFVYMSVKASSTDGSPHSVELYSDVTGEWLADDLGTTITWDETTAASTIFHKASPVDPSPMAEKNGIAEDATLYFGMARAPSLTWQSGFADDVRAQFNKTGALLDEGDAAYRAVNDRWPVFSLAWDLGGVDGDAKEAVWALGLARRPVVQYTSGSDSQARYPYYLTEYSSADDAFEAFISDYDEAAGRADALDARIMGAAGGVSSHYADLVALGTRQTFAGAEFTVPQATRGFDASDVLAFMKQSGDSGRVNPVETLYASWPAFLYINATWAGYLLEPLLRFQSSDAYTKDFAAPDLGSYYPTAAGNKSPGSSLAVEACGDMLIMAYAHAQVSGDGSLLGQYYDTLRSWADYLVANAQNPPGSQKLPGGADGADNANLALKGIVGLQAMAGISTAVGQAGEAASYGANASSFIGIWADELQANDKAGPSHTGLMYNLFADRLIKSEMVPDDVFNAINAAYSAPRVQSPYGIPYDSSSTTARSDWTLLTAASLPDAASGTRDALIEPVWARAANRSLAGAFPAAYDASTGADASGRASPAQGAAYAALALSLPSTTITVPAAAAPASAAGTSAPRAGPIAGGVVGGLAALAALGAAAVWYLRRRRRKPEGRYDLAEGAGGSAAAHEIKPFYGYEGASASVVGQVREAAPAAAAYAVPVVGYAVPAVGYAVPAVGYAGAQHGAYESGGAQLPFAGQPSGSEPSRGSWIAVDAAPAPRACASAAEEKRRLRLASSASGGGHASRPSRGAQSPLAPSPHADQAGGAPLGDALEAPPPEYRRAPW